MAIFLAILVIFVRALYSPMTRFMAIIALAFLKDESWLLLIIARICQLFEMAVR